MGQLFSTTNQMSSNGAKCARLPSVYVPDEANNSYKIPVDLGARAPFSGPLKKNHGEATYLSLNNESR